MKNPVVRCGLPIETLPVQQVFCDCLRESTLVGHGLAVHPRRMTSVRKLQWNNLRTPSPSEKGGVRLLRVKRISLKTNKL